MACHRVHTAPPRLRHRGSHGQRAPAAPPGQPPARDGLACIRAEQQGERNKTGQPVLKATTRSRRAMANKKGRSDRREPGRPARRQGRAIPLRPVHQRQNGHLVVQCRSGCHGGMHLGRWRLQLQAQGAIEPVRAEGLRAGRIIIARLAYHYQFDGARSTTDQLQRLGMDQRHRARHSHHAEKPRQNQA